MHLESDDADFPSNLLAFCNVAAALDCTLSPSVTPVIDDGGRDDGGVGTAVVLCRRV